MFGLFGKGAIGLGIDVGSGGVKVVELSGGKQLALSNYGELSNAAAFKAMHDPSAAVGHGDVEHEVGSLIHQLLEAMHVKHRRAAMALPAHTVHIAVLEFPAMHGRDLHDAVLYQAERLVTVPLAEVVLDWEGVEERPETEDRPPATLVLVAAVDRAVVDRYVRIAKYAGVGLSGLEAEPFSAVRMASQYAHGPYAILDFGGSRSSLFFANSNTLRAVHEVEMTGSKLTTALAHAMMISEERAEALKIEHGLIPAGGANLRLTLGPFVDGLVGEIRSRFAEHAQRTGGASVEKLYVCGGAARLKGFVEYLNEQFGIPVEGLSAFGMLKIPQKLAGHVESIAPSFAIASGLALRHRNETHNTA
jgi:type IV pilus assembly protein PilM